MRLSKDNGRSSVSAPEATDKAQPGTGQIPQRAIELIKEFEGCEKKLPDGRVQAYPDPNPKTGWKLPTIGYGSTRCPDGSPVRKGQIITRDEAEEYLMYDLDKIRRPALEKIPTWKDMNENQRAALYSFSFNLGSGFYRGRNFESITKVCDSPQRWNDQEWVKEQFVKYRNPGTNVESGLRRRREAEAKLFCTPPSTPQPETGKAARESSDQVSKVEVVKESPLKHANPAVQRQIDRLTQYLPSGKTLNLETKTRYFSQRDNYRDAHRTCNSSSNAMYLDWLLRMIGKPGLDSDDGYLKKVFSIGDSPDHSVQTKAIKQYGFNTKWMTDRDTPFVEDLVEAGFPVVVNILHKGPITNPSGGHIIMLIDQKAEDWIAHDPWGTLTSQYKEHKGEYSRISKQEFSARWQGGYRILA